MSVIWKYKLEPGWQAIRMPAMAQLLAVQINNDEPHLWALVNPTQPLADREIAVYATGQKVEEGTADRPGRYVGTFQLRLTQMLVFHVFDYGDRERDQYPFDYGDREGAKGE
jgi:hypothetical protein